MLLKRILPSVVIALSLLMATFSAHAEERAYASFDDVPDFLGRRLGPINTLEKYMAKMLSMMRVNDPTRNVLTQAGIESLESDLYVKSRDRQARLIMSLDKNSDNELSKKETERSKFSSDTHNYGDLMKIFDTDNNGKISFIEASVISSEQVAYNSPYNWLDDLLALDPNIDGVLTIDELKRLVINAFEVLDANGDGIISKKERFNVLDLNKDGNVSGREKSKRRELVWLREFFEERKIVLIERHIAPPVEKLNMSKTSELHVVGVRGGNVKYNGKTSFNGQKYAPVVDVYIKRPAKEVSLVLMSKDTLTWRIHADANVTITDNVGE